MQQLGQDFCNHLTLVWPNPSLQVAGLLFQDLISVEANKSVPVNRVTDCVMLSKVPIISRRLLKLDTRLGSATARLNQMERNKRIQSYRFIR